LPPEADLMPFLEDFLLSMDESFNIQLPSLSQVRFLSARK
jgi:hypothetical protein